MFYTNNILLTHFFDKYRLRSSSKYIGITDQAIIDSFSKSFSNDVQFAELCSRLTDLVIFSESILPYIDFNRQFLTNWMPEHIISRVGIAYNDAKANTDLLNLSMEILKRRQNSNSNDGISR